MSCVNLTCLIYIATKGNTENRMNLCIENWKFLSDCVCGKILQLKKAEEKYRNSKSKLALFQGKKNGSLLDAGKTKHGSNSLIRKNETPSKILHQSKAQHFNPKTSQCIQLPDSAKALINYNAGANLTQRFPIELDNKGTKRKYGKTFILRQATRCCI